MITFTQLPYDVQHGVARASEWANFLCLAQTSKDIRLLSKRVLRERMINRIGSLLVGAEETFAAKRAATQRVFEVLEMTDGIIAGSVPLALMTVPADMDHTLITRNINIIVYAQTVTEWYKLLLHELHFYWVEPERVRPEIHECISSFAVFGRDGVKITISGTRSRSLIPTLVASKFTSQMNFMTRTSLYSLYPHLTAEKLALPSWSTGRIDYQHQAARLHNQHHFGAFVANSSSVPGPCGAECPRIYRQSEGLVGVGEFNFGDDDEEFEDPVNFGQTARVIWRLFEHGRLPLILMHLLPFDVQFTILNEAMFSALLAYSAVSRSARKAAKAVVHHRINLLLHHFKIPAQERSNFWMYMAAAMGGITGSSVFWATQSAPTWFPSNLNILVGKGGLDLLEPFFDSMGFTKKPILSRIPRVLGALRRPPILAYLPGSVWTPTTTRFHSPLHRRSVTVTETRERTPMRLLLEAEHTIQAALITPSALILLYPESFLTNTSILRQGGVHRRASFDDDPMVFRAVQWTRRGVQITGAFKPTYNAPCPPTTCPGLTRRLRGGRGVLIFSWSAMNDLLGTQARHGFKSGLYAFIWSWSICQNYLCIFFRQPGDVFVRGRRPVFDEAPPKISEIHEKSEALSLCQPGFATMYRALYFPTSSWSAVFVPLALDHHAKTYQTIDDLRVHYWLVPRAPGATKIPLFLSPLTAPGGTALASMNTTQIYTAEKYTLIVFVEETARLGRRNMTLYSATDTDEQDIHGDVLVVCFKDAKIIDPAIVGIANCRREIKE
uniref:F-box domain-containing protein n=1 Tax=Mycena chlorophos TaxID=658473 RepID=A0ABQ0KUG5_MYCCL|nr:predicted protein [Mycena chlorophos]